jgi:hypothetical protein
MGPRSSRSPIRRVLAWASAIVLAALLAACAAAPTATVQVPPTSAPPTATVQASPTAVPATPAVATPTPTAPTAVRTAPGTARLGSRISLRVGQTATFATEVLTLRFTAVTDDSRCPKAPGIACATSGWATIAVDAAQGQQMSTISLRIPGLTDDTTRLTTVPGSPGFAADFAVYRIQLVSLEPQPGAIHATPATADYVATLLVTAPRSAAIP